MTLSMVGLLSLIIACSAVIVWGWFKKLAKARRRHFVECLEKALGDSAEIHS